MPFTAVPGANIYWKMEGCDAAPVVILLNSIGTDMDLWDPVLPRLREHFRLLRIDTRGHGASSAALGDVSMARLAEDVLAVAGAAEVDRFSLAGVSLGGMIGMELALVCPKRVERLALVCTSATMDADAWNDRVSTVRDKGMRAIAELSMGRFLSAAFREERPEISETIRRQLLLSNTEGYASCATAIRDMDLADRISDIACPTLVVTGSRDASTPLEGHGEYLLANIDGSIHIALDAAHLAPLEAPDALAAALISFLHAKHRI